MPKIHYRCQGICAVSIDATVDEHDCVQEVTFEGGCPGNHLGLARLVKGMPRTEVIRRLEGTHCGDKPTSCPDQLAQALKSLS